MFLGSKDEKIVEIFKIKAKNTPFFLYPHVRCAVDMGEHRLDGREKPMKIENNQQKSGF
jgi:hypothetical protein